MAQVLIKAVSMTHLDPTIDRIGMFKRGMPVTVTEDNHVWGIKETLPNFAVIKVPTISVAKVRALVMPQTIVGPDGHPVTYRKRRWILLWNDLPAAAQSIILAQGYITIKAGSYSGQYDYTWEQVKNLFKDQETDFTGFEIT